MPAKLIRIVSDVHYGDLASGVKDLRQLRGVTEGVDALILNGDSLDTRPGPHPERTAAHLAEIRKFFAESGIEATFVTGNHDPDISTCHFTEVAGGRVLVTHGDIAFDEIVPWGRDAGLIRDKLRQAWGGAANAAAANLETRLDVYRAVAATIPQRHQSEQNPLKYAVRFAADTVWPIWRIPRICNAWRVQPARMAALIRRHRPDARFVIVGHTHFPGSWKEPGGVTVINTGSYCGILGALSVDVTEDRLIVRRITRAQNAYMPGRTVGEFRLE